MSKKIQIKNVAVLAMLLDRKYHPMLLEIILHVAYKYGLCFTEGYRSPRHPGDVHSTDPLRAVDLRSWFYRPNVAEEIKEEINNRWEYDYKRPEKKCCMIHKVEDGVKHFHIQVHPNTKRRESLTYGRVL